MKMKHPDSVQVISVSAKQVPLYERQGWKRYRPPAKPAK